ncbi:hypothetical protein [uncultured Meiothermus sp.]|uniref:hypothetical protein n=1 Tax=uncultured Meiothermus sp. TaxID=157471 RepID=UPI002619224F|nr:hypothetical protein [uncultured Meiothermus sp.]
MVVSLALAQTQAQPIDLLQRPEDDAGTLRFSIGLKYDPRGFHGFGSDPVKGPFGLTVVGHNMVVSASLEYAYTPQVSASVLVSPGLRLTQTERAFVDRTEREDLWEPRSLAALGASFRLDPGGTFDPRVSLALEYPWLLRLSAAVSLLRDPVVLRATAGFSDALDSGSSRFSLGLSAGFVANDLISFSLGSSLDWVVGALGLPNVSLSLRTSYTLDPQTERQLAARTSVSFAGGEGQVGLGLEWSGRLW